MIAGVIWSFLIIALSETNRGAVALIDWVNISNCILKFWNCTIYYGKVCAEEEGEGVGDKSSIFR